MDQPFINAFELHRTPELLFTKEEMDAWVTIRKYQAECLLESVIA